MCKQIASLFSRFFLRCIEVDAGLLVAGQFVLHDGGSAAGEPSEIAELELWQ